MQGCKHTEGVSKVPVANVGVHGPSPVGPLR